MQGSKTCAVALLVGLVAGVGLGIAALPPGEERVSSRSHELAAGAERSPLTIYVMHLYSGRIRSPDKK